MNTNQGLSVKRNIKIMLIDDHVLFRQGLKAMLVDTEGIEVIGEIGDGRGGLKLAEQLRPDVVLLDISMEGIGGLELAPRFRALLPETEIVILTMHNNQDYIYRALKAGCRGYMLKSDSEADLQAAIKSASEGRTFISPAVSHGFIDHLISRTKDDSSLLTAREREVADQILQGLSTDQIAASLFISAKTVRVHIANIKKKLSCSSRTGLLLRLQEIEKD